MKARSQPTREQLAVCAHDLRGILTVIAGYADLLRRDDMTEQERVDALDGIDAAIKRADRLLGDTLAGRVTEHAFRERVDIASAAEQAAADARASSGRDIPLMIEDRPSVDGDSLAVERMLENLLNNAVKYAPTGPIELHVSEVGGLATIRVSDQGPGIPSEERERVFEPFARLDRDLAAPGSGLGLTVVRSAAERMGGRVFVDERDGGGAVVRVELPTVS